MTIDIVIIYSLVSFFYIISPGPAVFLALANGMNAGMKAVSLSSLGNIIGLFFLSTISIIGLGSIILASVTLFSFVKIIGAAYLIYLGLKQFKSSKRKGDSDLQSYAPEDRTHHSYILEGFLLASTNPKAILFFVAIFPQFLKIELPLIPQFFIMTTLFMAISFYSLFSYGYAAKSAKKVFSNKTSMKWFHRITGGLFIGMGFGLLQLRNAQG